VMLLAFAGIWQYLSLGKLEYVVGCSLIVSTQLMVIGMFLAAISGKRGLRSESDGLEKTIYVLYALGGILCTLALTAILIALICQQGPNLLCL